jgi:hypothetical protein
MSDNEITIELTNEDGLGEESPRELTTIRLHFDTRYDDGEERYVKYNIVVAHNNECIGTLIETDRGLYIHWYCTPPMDSYPRCLYDATETIISHINKYYWR